jgi:hypothetical protein
MSRIQKVHNGLKLAGTILLFFGWLVLVLAGVGWLTDNEGSLAKGIAALTLSGALAVFSVNRWVKVLPGILGYGVIGAIANFWRGDTEVSTAAAGMLVLLLAGCALVAQTFSARELNSLDRLALVGCVASFIYGITAEERSLFGAVLMFSCLAVAWIAATIQRRRTGPTR